ncbi:bifunctional 4-hydroxy-2-oxoglutarate aldolase/2-dehydro-3-deoxy-phosphogluconate aldolase [Allofrancisella guangzhouensis]|uniref:4-hydroxy-2-ketovalerate aldolase n=1 Tax=Allofrancisella guangzhouensis TaxID=594679 RepID=A0A0A8E4G5_9GAMM|nr:bifunctional 4-hydroxy-2-oxoglutarate aldolase/2-dehydro-3-deoxy-phosphogluconate aldolase [Allofrancisella guangzhouensis]AJC49075.1 4-hydroxy-2-ketovalerate aldolase [Allofrancisella guangzhouensis]MBK2026908.1 bifunctional 4-hydroxy-2-oxoglutarate aldolase/2-dehydro-3-deoxy-phosphogluconate aldolase [Allofrancisella guangzhouensis]MBK2044369.1 bifunctional 4-hydroxy-2-oxoglutarate aldolase/2-dehydro-3-deoxy-phosphogluconate aldolase [Allofrancisella guangzhouensis]MBK2046275.1 bifunctiona
MQLTNLLEKNPLIPVVAVNTVDEAYNILYKLRNKNIKIVEFTLRTPNALEVIKEVIENNQDLTIGIGTITTLEQLRKCSFLGADFLVSPGVTIEMLKFARDHNLPYLPGGVTAFEIMTILEYRFNVIKFFPAEVAGGINLLRNYQAVFPQVKFCASGGINITNKDKYLNQENVIAIGSSSLI